MLRRMCLHVLLTTACIWGGLPTVHALQGTTDSPSNDLRKRVEDSILFRGTNPASADIGVMIFEDIAVFHGLEIAKELERSKRKRMEVILANQLGSSLGNSPTVAARIVSAGTSYSSAFVNLLEPEKVGLLQIEDGSQLKNGDTVYCVQLNENAQFEWKSATLSKLQRHVSGEILGFSFEQPSSSRIRPLLVVSTTGKLVGMRSRSSEGSFVPCSVIEREVIGFVSSFECVPSESNQNVVTIKLTLADPIKNVSSVQFEAWKSSTDQSERERILIPFERREADGGFEANVDFQTLSLKSRDSTLSGYVIIKGSRGERQDGPYLVSSAGMLRKTEKASKRKDDASESSPGVRVDVAQLNRISQGPYSQKLVATLEARIHQYAEQQARKQTPQVSLPTPFSPNFKQVEKKASDSSSPPSETIFVQTSFLTLGDAEPLQAVSHPHGTHVFLIQESDPNVYVLNTTDFTIERTIAVPPDPVSIWCDADSLVVASNKSRVVTFIDLHSEKKMTSSIRSIWDSDASSFAPKRLLGRGPDGSVMSIWGHDEWSIERLYFLKPDSSPLHVATARATNYIFPLGAGLAIEQNEKSSPHAIPRLVAINSGKFTSLDILPELARLGLGKHQDHGRAILTDDKKNVLIPVSTKNRNANAGKSDSSSYMHETLLFSGDLKSYIATIPGIIFNHIPEHNLFLSAAIKPGNTAEDYSWDVLYIERRSNRVLRTIRFEKFYLAREIGRGIDANQLTGELTYVPGREVLLVRQSLRGKRGWVMIPCGTNEQLVQMDTALVAEQSSDNNPLLEESKPRIPANWTPTLSPDSKPPNVVKVGDELRFTPEVTLRQEWKAKFVLVRKVPGMTINENSGTISFIPKQAQLGLYDVRIVIEIDGIQYHLLDWILRIEDPK
ncbi:YncE family protein [Pirellulaceae bacterium SH449]